MEQITFSNFLSQRININIGLFKIVNSSIGIPHLGTRIRKRLIKNLLENYINKKNGTFADLGCGYGFNIDLFGARQKIYAIDDDKKRLNIAKKLFAKKNTEFMVGNIYHLPFPDNYFDLVLLTEVLEHLKSDKRAMLEITRVIKKDGFLLISVPSYEQKGIKQWEEVGHVRSGYSKFQLNKLVESFGFMNFGYESFGNGVIEKIILYFDHYLMKTSPILPAVFFPLLYPIYLLTEGMFSKEHPYGIIVLYKKLEVNLPKQKFV